MGKEMKKSHSVSASKPAATATTVYVVITKKWQKNKVRSSFMDVAKKKARHLFNCSGKIYICIIQTSPPPDSLSMSYADIIT